MKIFLKKQISSNILLIFTLMVPNVIVMSRHYCEKTVYCFNENKNIVALCIYNEDSGKDECDGEPLQRIYENNNCTPEKQCTAPEISYCKNDPCFNNGQCNKLRGTYSCTCSESFHGRDCSKTVDAGKKYVKDIYFVYSPDVDLYTPSLCYIFIKELGDDIRIEFSAKLSGEVFKISKNQIKFLQNGWRNSSKIYKPLCKGVPEGPMNYVDIIYSIMYKPDGPNVKKIGKSNFPVYDVNTLSLKVYNVESEEFNQDFTQLVSFRTKFKLHLKCVTPVKIENCGETYKTPLQINRKTSQIIRGSFVQNTENSVCAYAITNLTWSIYKFEGAYYEMDEEKDRSGDFQYEVIPFKTFEIGLYKVQLELKLSARELPQETYIGLCFIDVIRLPLSIEIKGGSSKTVKQGEPFVLDASQSNDPNKPPNEKEHLKWLWTCDTTGVTCDGQSGNSPVCKVTRNFQVGTVLKFTLTLSTQGESSTASQTVTVSEIAQVQLDISCLKNCGINSFKTNPKEVVYLEVKVTDNSTVQNFKWSYSIDGQPEKLNADEIKQGGVSSNILIVKENQLKPGSKYTFIVTPDELAVEGASTIDILVNQSPSKGVCNILPETGIKANTEFTILCSNFTAETSMVQLKYEFYQITAGIPYPGTLVGFSVSGELKKVILTESIITVRVSDVYGMYTEVNTTVKLEDWNPIAEDLNQMVAHFNDLRSTGDIDKSVRLAGAIIDSMKNASSKSDLVNRVLEGLNEKTPSDFSDVKLYSSLLKKIVVKAVPELERGIGSTAVRSMGTLMASVSERLLKEMSTVDKRDSQIQDGDVKDIALSMLDCSDVIVTSDDQSIFNASTGSLAMFATHDQFKKGTAGLVRALGYTGMAILSGLLPHQAETVVETSDTLMWLKVESPENLASLSGIPSQSKTKIKMSKQLGRALQEKSDNVAMEVVTFKNNVYWWDVQDRDVASEIVLIRVWEKSSSSMNEISEITEPLDVYLNIKNLKFQTLSGNVTLPHPDDSEDQKDLAVVVHTIEAPHENSNGKLFVEFQDLQDVELLVLITANIRPDYQMMINEAQTISQTSLSISFSFENITADSLHFIGILPGPNVTANQTVQYSLNIYSIQCKVRQVTVWTSPACVIGEETSKEVVHCRCSHMSFFGSSIFVAPNSVHPIKDLHLFLTVPDNPVVFALVVTMLIIYVTLLIWARVQEKKDIIKRKVIVLKDNFPGDKYPYLLVVYTALNIGSATGSNVGIELIGSYTSRAHILRSPERQVFRRNSDDWFLILTPMHLGPLKAIHLWHDNSGPHPDWYCKKINVYDLTSQLSYSFLVEQWMSVWPGEYTQAVVQAVQSSDLYQWDRVVVHNIMYNFREKHMWLSIFLCHPRATMSKSKRLTSVYCIIMVSFLTGIMFYGVARGKNSVDEAKYTIKAREIIIAVQCAVCSAVVTSLVITCFKRSQVVVQTQPPEGISNINAASGQPNQETTDENKTPTQQEGSPDKRCWLRKLLFKILHGMVKGKPLMPILVGKESSASVIRRRRWARAGWVLSQIVIWGSAFFTILYGLKLGKVISELWVTSVVISLTQGIFFSNPMKIILFSTVLAAFGEFYDVTTYECEIEGAMQKEHFGDRIMLSNLVHMRSSPVYRPLPAEKTRSLYYHEPQNEILRARQRKTFPTGWKDTEVLRQAALRRNRVLQRLEFVATVLLLVALFNITGDLSEKHTYYTSSHIAKSLTISWKASSVSLQDAIDAIKLTDYLISTLVPSLYKEKWYNGNTLTSEGESLAEMGWLSDSTHRLIGVPQLRQIRVKPRNCSFTSLFNVSKAVCLDGLKKKNEDTSNHGLYWGPFSKYINKPLLVPWTYRSNVRDSSVMYGASGLPYHSGGYIVRLDDTQKKCNTIISDLLDSGWWDIKMRAFIMELTLYNPNTNTHCLITVITEHLASGSFTSRLQVMPIHISFHVICMVLFFSILLSFNFRLVIEVNREGIAATLSGFWSRYDLILVGLSDITVFVDWIKVLRASRAVHVFQQKASSDFFYFSNIVFHQRLSLFLWCLVLCLAPIRILKFKPFVSTCQAACYTLYTSRKILSIVSLIIIFVISFQMLVINFTICPVNFPLDVDTIFYKTGVNAHYYSSYNFYLMLISLLLVVTFTISVLILQTVLIFTHKIVSD